MRISVVKVIFRTSLGGDTLSEQERHTCLKPRALHFIVHVIRYRKVFQNYIPNMACCSLSM